MPVNLSVTNFSFTDTTWETGEIIQITFDMQNTGTDPLSSSGIRVSVKDSGGNHLVFLGPVDTPAVPAGSTVNVTANLTIQNVELPAGTYTVQLWFNNFSGVNAFSNNSTMTTSGITPFTIFDDAYEIPTGGGTFDALDGNDNVIGSASGEVIIGGNGDDTLNPDGGNDTVYGGAGMDSFYVSYSVFTGGSSVTALPGSNELHGGDGADYFNTYSMSDTIYGDAGDDTIHISQLVDMTQAAANTHSGVMVDGGAGNDLIESRAENLSFIRGNTLNGGDGDDTIRSNNAADVINGGAGADTIDLALPPFNLIVLPNFVSAATQTPGAVAHGGDGADTVTGSALDDKITGGAGKDSLMGGDGNDTLRGGESKDVLKGGNGNDSILGGKGNDSIVGQKGNDRLYGNKNNDTLKGGGGNDRLDGEFGKDFLKGGSGNDRLNGGSGGDRIVGNNGDDKLNGGKGDDLLNAGGGADTLNGGKGNDTLKGGAGADTFVFQNGHGSDRVLDFDAQDDNEVLDVTGLNSLSSFTDVTAAATQVGSDVLITTGANSSILLVNVQLSDLDANDFLF